MNIVVDKDTALCISLAARPSNHGVRFHNWLYQTLGLNFQYHSVAPSDITAAVAGIRGLNIRGAGVSMPYKTDVIQLLDVIDPSAERINAVNTIVNDEGILTGHNTDYSAVLELLQYHEVDPGMSVTVHGSGGMAKAVIAALNDYGMSGIIFARNENTARELAAQFGWVYSPVVPENTQFIVNTTPLGMNGPDSDVLAFEEDVIAQSELVFDVVAYPINTPLIEKATELDKATIHGGEVMARQAAKQFHLYTGVMPSAEQINSAEEFAQQ